MNIAMSEPYRVIGIDPGSSKTGFSALSFMPDGKVKVEKAFTISVSATLPQYKDLSLIHGERTIRILIITDALTRLIKEFKPHWIMCESPFARHIQTYASLTECVTNFRMASMRIDPYVPFEVIDPVSVKKNIGVKLGGGKSKERKDKDLVESLVRARKDVVDFDNHDIDEHCSDATAIALVHIDRCFHRGV